jgi:hypothetical protein
MEGCASGQRNAMHGTWDVKSFITDDALWFGDQNAIILHDVATLDALFDVEELCWVLPAF